MTWMLYSINNMICELQSRTEITCFRACLPLSAHPQAREAVRRLYPLSSANTICAGVYWAMRRRNSALRNLLLSAAGRQSFERTKAIDYMKEITGKYFTDLCVKLIRCKAQYIMLCESGLPTTASRSE